MPQNDYPSVAPSPVHDFNSWLKRSTARDHNWQREGGVCCWVAESICWCGTSITGDLWAGEDAKEGECWSQPMPYI